MKKIFILLALYQSIQATEIETFKGREGFKFGLGVVVVGSCYEEEIWDEKGENIISTNKYCGALPILDMEIGYNISKQFGLSLDVKTLLLGSFVGMKAKYYMQNARDTAFISITGGTLNVGGGHSPGVSSYNNIEWGYAYGDNEFSVGAGVPYGDKDMLVHVSYKYMF